MSQAPLASRYLRQLPTSSKLDLPLTEQLCGSIHDTGQDTEGEARKAKDKMVLLAEVIVLCQAIYCR